MLADLQLPVLIVRHCSESRTHCWYDDGPVQMMLPSVEHASLHWPKHAFPYAKHPGDGTERTQFFSVVQTRHPAAFVVHVLNVLGLTHWFCPTVEHSLLHAHVPAPVQILPEPQLLADCHLRQPGWTSAHVS